MQRGLVETRSAAKGLIMARRVLVDGEVADKAGAQVLPSAGLEIKQGPRFVSRAGEKLARALEIFAVEPRGRLCLDVGASTGGFVDCLLQAGAGEVVAVDVGYGQLDSRLRDDPRVHVLERTNARYLTSDDLPFAPELITADVSFISLRKLLPAIIRVAAPGFLALLMLKPQFEAGRQRVGKGGIVRDPQVHEETLLSFIAHLRGEGLTVLGVTDTGLPGMGGNREFFVYASAAVAEGPSLATLELDVKRAVWGVPQSE